MDNRKFWTKIKQLRGNKKKEIRAIKDNQNRIKTEKEEILQTWNEYYLEIFL